MMNIRIRFCMLLSLVLIRKITIFFRFLAFFLFTFFSAFFFFAILQLVLTLMVCIDNEL